MKNRTIFYTALIATILAINPLTPTKLNAATKSQASSLSLNVAKILHKRGLDDDVARELSENFFLENEALFSMMLNNIENGCNIISETELMNYISSSILQRKSIKLDSYEYLVGMVYKIKNRALSNATLQELKNISTKNSLFSQYIA